MNYCSRHQDKKALSFCHNCGKYFCKECLTEGKEYYYCSNSDCQKQMHLEEGEEITNKPVPDNEQKEFTRFDADMNQMDSAVFKSVLDDNGIEYYATNGSFFEVPSEFYIRSDQMEDVYEILKNFKISHVYYSTKNDLTD